jgi:hypothetical protein
VKATRRSLFRTYLHPTIPIHYNNYIGRGDISIRSFLKGYKTADQLSDDFLALAKEL